MSTTTTQKPAARFGAISGPEAAAMLGISPTHFKRSIDSGELNIPFTVPVKQRRFKRQDVERYLTARGQGPVILDRVEDDELR